jgi:hypothetical protein
MRLDDGLIIPATEVVLLFKLGENEVLSAPLIILNKHVLRNLIGFEHPTLRALRDVFFFRNYYILFISHSLVSLRKLPFFQFLHPCGNFFQMKSFGNFEKNPSLVRNCA